MKKYFLSMFAFFSLGLFEISFAGQLETVGDEVNFRCDPIYTGIDEVGNSYLQESLTPIQLELKRAQGKFSVQLLGKESVTVDDIQVKVIKETLIDSFGRPGIGLGGRPTQHTIFVLQANLTSASCEIGIDAPGGCVTFASKSTQDFFLCRATENK